MEEKLKIIKNDIALALQSYNIIITAIDYIKEGKYYFLRFELDKVNGLDLDAIVEATNVINPIVDKLDIFDEAYILDVISKEKGVIENG